MAGVYGDVDFDTLYAEAAGVPVEEELETPATGYYQIISQIKSRIDSNMEVIYNFVESLKISQEQDYQQIAREYNRVHDQYTALIQAAFVTGEQALSESEKTGYINQLNTILAYTDEFIAKLDAAGFRMPPEQSVEAEGLPPSALPSTTAMVKHDDNEIVMENVGPLRAWWQGLNPGLKTVIKAAMIGGAIFGGKMAFEWFADKYYDTKEGAEG